MGFPIKSNIFRKGTNEQRYFASFPVQAIVLFSPDDVGFSNSFKDIFLKLDKITGDKVVFFSVLDPPSDWLIVTNTRPVWQNYQSRIGNVGFSYDDKVLVNEISRMFGINWQNLPSLVISTNLWGAEFIVCETSEFILEKQLQFLTELVNEWGEPNIGQIKTVLDDKLGRETIYHPPDEELRYGLYRFYNFVDTMPSQNNFDKDKFNQLTGSELKYAQRHLSRARNYSRQDENEFDSQSSERAIEDIAGRLVMPATIAQKVYKKILDTEISNVLDYLNEESQIMIETSLRIGNLLELDKYDNNLFRLSARDFHKENRTDFTPSSQGVWKSIELEANLSLIQAARASRSIKMPTFFGLFDSSLPPNKSKVRINFPSKVFYKDINQIDWENKSSGRHRFLTLGDIYLVINEMKNSPAEIFNDIIKCCIDSLLPEETLRNLKYVHKLRNKGSHINIISKEEYIELLDEALNSDLLRVLLIIKKKLSTKGLTSFPSRPP